MTRYFVTNAGAYIGAFDGTYVPGEPVGEDEDGNIIPGDPVYLFPDIPEGAVEVGTAPDDARQIYDFGNETWLPAPLPLPRIISRRQFYQGLAVAEFITKTEALDAIRTGTLPAAIQAIVDGMTDEDAKFTAEMLLAGATEFDVEHPLVLVFAVAQDMSPSEVEDFWRLCASLT